MNLALNLIDKQVVASTQVVILTLYRAQYKTHRKALRNLFMTQSRMADIQVKTMKIMQGGQATVIMGKMQRYFRIDHQILGAELKRTKH